MSSGGDITLILDDWGRGDKSALDRLVPLVYPQIHNIAKAHLRRNTRAATLQTTAVVNELFLKLLAKRPEKIENRLHFFSLAARIIRLALIQHYRHATAQKRGPSVRVPLHDDMQWVDAAGEEIVEFDRALSELEALDPLQAEMFSIRFLVGCTADETAALMGISKATVDRKVKLARAWLFQRLK